MIATSCNAVLILPPSLAAITSPCAEAMLRRPLMARSRAISTTTTQAATRASATMKTSTAVTSSLSASGSRNLPSMLTSPRLARQIAVHEVARRGHQVEQAAR